MRGRSAHSGNGVLPKLGRSGPSLRAGSARLWPSLARARPNSAERSPYTLPNFALAWTWSRVRKAFEPLRVHERSLWFGPTFGRFQAIGGRVFLIRPLGPVAELGRSCPKFGRSGPSSANFDRCRPHLSRNQPGFGHMLAISAGFGPIWASVRLRFKNSLGAGLGTRLSNTAWRRRQAVFIRSPLWCGWRSLLHASCMTSSGLACRAGASGYRHALAGARFMDFFEQSNGEVCQEAGRQRKAGTGSREKDRQESPLQHEMPALAHESLRRLHSATRVGVDSGGPNALWPLWGVRPIDRARSATEEWTRGASKEAPACLSMPLNPWPFGGRLRDLNPPPVRGKGRRAHVSRAVPERHMAGSARLAMREVSARRAHGAVPMGRPDPLRRVLRRGHLALST